MKSDLLPDTLRGGRTFRWRGGDVSRLEGLSDAVFALSLTLLVVALEVPRTSQDLVRLFWQFPAFAVCFAFLLWVWYEHYTFHRRFGFEDAGTVALNGLLLFFVVFYVYPLKFLATALITTPLSGRELATIGSEAQAVMILYSTGFIGIFAVMSAMNWRAWSRRQTLQLNAAEREATLGSLRSHLSSTAIGLLSLLMALFMSGGAGISGLVFFLMGPVQGVNGAVTARRVKRAAESDHPSPS